MSVELLHRVHVATVVRFEAYRIIGPKLEDEDHTATADMLLKAHALAWKGEHPEEPEPERFGFKFQAREIIEAPDVNAMCFLRCATWLEANCCQAASWEQSPARAVLHEMMLKAIPLLEGWDTYRHEIDPESAEWLKHPGSKPTAGWYTGAQIRVPFSWEPETHPPGEDPRYRINWDAVSEAQEEDM